VRWVELIASLVSNSLMRGGQLAPGFSSGDIPGNQAVY